MALEHSFLPSNAPLPNNLSLVESSEYYHARNIAIEQKMEVDKNVENKYKEPDVYHTFFAPIHKYLTMADRNGEIVCRW